MVIREANASDSDAIWKILEPVIRGGDTYTLPADMKREEALAYWNSPGHEVFVTEENGEILGTYYLRANRGAGDPTLRIAGTSPLRGRADAALRGPCANIRWSVPKREAFARCNLILW
jgi:hypothetical protein